MTKPGRKRAPKGDARRGDVGTVVDKDNKAYSAQRQAKADLIERMREKTRETP